LTFRWCHGDVINFTRVLVRGRETSTSHRLSFWGAVCYLLWELSFSCFFIVLSQKKLWVLCVWCWILLVALWKLYRKMRPISWEKEQNIIALIEKGRSSREIIKSVGLAQSTVNRVRKRLSTSVALSKGGRPKVLTKWEKCYASRVVTVGGLETATEASKVLWREMGVKMCDNTLRNALREQRLSSFTKLRSMLWVGRTSKTYFILLKCTKIGL
jgi:transposase